LTVDGKRIPLRFTKVARGESSGGTVAVAAVATTVLLGPVGLLWGLKKGKPATIAAGNRYTVFVQGNNYVKGEPIARDNQENRPVIKPEPQPVVTKQAPRQEEKPPPVFVNLPPKTDKKKPPTK
jgi:hypothetical protein